MDTGITFNDQLRMKPGAMLTSCSSGCEEDSIMKGFHEREETREDQDQG